jgi:hypothetical protein
MCAGRKYKTERERETEFEIARGKDEDKMELCAGVLLIDGAGLWKPVTLNTCH